MSRARELIGRLIDGETIEVRAYGRSMQGRIESGSLVRVRPIGSDESLVPGDVVLCRIHRHTYLHLIKAVEGDRYLIGNNIGGINGWAQRQEIYGKLETVI